MSSTVVLYSCKARDFTESNKQIVRVLDPDIVVIKMTKIVNSNSTKEYDNQDEDKLGTCVRKKMKIFSKYAGPEEEEEDEYNESEETKCDFEKEQSQQAERVSTFRHESHRYLHISELRGCDVCCWDCI